MRKVLSLVVTALFLSSTIWAAETVKIGFNYSKTGPFASQGEDQMKAVALAVEDINAKGGILGKQVVVVEKDTQANADLATANVTDLIAGGAQMIMGGSSSNVAVAMSKVCQEKGVLCFPVLSYAPDVTDEKGHRHTFRECYNSWAAAKVLSSYMRKNFAGKRYFYITADYSWGSGTEAVFRKFTGTTDQELHKGIKTKFPGATADDFKKAIETAMATKPDVLVMVESGDDALLAARAATTLGIKDKTAVIVPTFTLLQVHPAGPQVMEGIIGVVDWAWNIPFKYNYAQGVSFVEKFAAKYNTYPGESANYSWTILHQYKDAVERAKSFDSAKVIKALEGHKYTGNKDAQYWRAWDHSSIQTVYAVRCKPAADVMKDKFKMDYFEVIATLPGDSAFKTKDEWVAARTAANMPPALEALPGEK